MCLPSQYVAQWTRSCKSDSWTVLDNLESVISFFCVPRSLFNFLRFTETQGWVGKVSCFLSGEESLAFPCVVLDKAGEVTRTLRSLKFHPLPGAGETQAGE